MEQRMINARKDMLRYVDTLHLMAMKFQNTVRELFPDSLALLVERLQTSFM